MVSALTGDGVARPEDLAGAARATRARGFIRRTRSPMRRCASSPPRSRAKSCSSGCTRSCPIIRRSKPRCGRNCARGDVRIEQTIYVERESQRKIVLGKGGQTIKAIGEAARKEIAEIAEAKVHLFLFVKVREAGATTRSVTGRWGWSFRKSEVEQARRQRICAMQWTDEGIVLGVKRHGEANAILELMTREHGRHLGLVRGGSGSRLKPILQPGNCVSATWRARLDEHLGNYYR